MIEWMKKKNYKQNIKLLKLWWQSQSILYDSYNDYYVILPTTTKKNGRIRSVIMKVCFVLKVSNLIKCHSNFEF